MIKPQQNMLKLFQKTSNIHSYNTRSSRSGKFYVKSSFSRLGVKLWNKIPRYITNLPKRVFKRVLRKLLFDILEKEDDYIQIPMIILKAGTYIHLLQVLASAFLFLCYHLRVLMHCTSVSAVLIRSLNFCVLFIFSCNLQGFLIV